MRSVAQEWTAFDLAIQDVREHGRLTVDIGRTYTAATGIEDVAWLRTMEAEVVRQGQNAGLDTSVYRRDIAFDVGLYWEGAWREFKEISDGGAGLYIDIVASHRQKAWSLVVKVGWSDLAAVFDHARPLGPPGQGWKPGPRRLSRDTAAVWVYPCSHETASAPSVLAAKAVEAALWIQSLPAR